MRQPPPPQPAVTPQPPMPPSSQSAVPPDVERRLAEGERRDRMHDRSINETKETVADHDGQIKAIEQTMGPMVMLTVGTTPFSVTTLGLTPAVRDQLIQLLSSGCSSISNIRVSATKIDFNATACLPDVLSALPQGIKVIMPEAATPAVKPEPKNDPKNE
jgi:hypothetical protein